MGAPVGNTNNASGKRFNLALERAIAEKSKGTDKWEALVAIGAKLLECAENGEGWAIKELADRLDGKAVQGVELGGKDGGPLVVQVLKFADTDT